MRMDQHTPPTPEITQPEPRHEARQDLPQISREQRRALQTEAGIVQDYTSFFRSWSQVSDTARPPTKSRKTELRPQPEIPVPEPPASVPPVDDSDKLESELTSDDDRSVIVVSEDDSETTKIPKKNKGSASRSENLEETQAVQGKPPAKPVKPRGKPKGKGKAFSLSDGKRSTRERYKRNQREGAQQQLQADTPSSGNSKNPNLSGKATPGAPVTVKNQKFEIFDDMIGRTGSRQCTKCEKFAKAWTEAEGQGISTEDVELAVDWTIKMHEEFHKLVPRQLYLLEKAYTFLHWDPPKIHLAVDLNSLQQRKEFEKEYETAKQSESNIRHIWVCYRDQGEVYERPSNEEIDAAEEEDEKIVTKCTYLI